jgi:hypothetical protein
MDVSLLKETSFYVILTNDLLIINKNKSNTGYNEKGARRGAGTWNLSNRMAVGTMPEYSDYCPMDCGSKWISAMPEYSDY